MLPHFIIHTYLEYSVYYEIILHRLNKIKFRSSSISIKDALMLFFCNVYSLVLQSCITLQHFILYYVLHSPFCMYVVKQSALLNTYPQCQCQGHKDVFLSAYNVADYIVVIQQYYYCMYCIQSSSQNFANGAFYVGLCLNIQCKYQQIRF